MQLISAKLIHIKIKTLNLIHNKLLKLMEWHNVKPLYSSLLHPPWKSEIIKFFKVLTEMISSYIPLYEEDYRSKKEKKLKFYLAQELESLK